MLRRLHLWTFIALSHVASASHAGHTSPIPFFAPYKASYQITWHGLSVGESHHQLTVQIQDTSTHAEERYTFSANTTPSIPFVPYSYAEFSTFTYKHHHIYPSHYRCEKKEGTKKKGGEWHFDWDKHQVVIIRPTDRKPLHLSVGILDEVSQNFALRKDLRAGKTKNLDYAVVHGADIRTYHFTWLGEEKIETKLGTLDTIKLEHASKNKDKRTIFWMSKSHDYLLVATEQFRNGARAARGEIVRFSPQVDTDS